MSEFCVPKYNFINKSVYFIIQIAILVLVLSLFFIFYVAGVTKTAVNHELSTLVNDNTNKLFGQVPPELQRPLKEAIQLVPKERLLNYYNREDKTVQNHNQWLFRMLIFANIFLIVLSTMAVIMAKSMCSGVDIKHILIENITIFALVAVVEFSFFKFIISKYHPAPPSFMLDTTINSLKANL